MKKNIKGILFGFAIFLSSHAPTCSAAQPQPIAISENAPITQLFPVNHSVLPKITLSITVPPTFRFMGNDLREARKFFIPKTDSNPNMWSRIINTQVSIGSKQQASALRNTYMNHIANNAQFLTILNENNNEYGFYSALTNTIYMDFNNRQAIQYTAWYSGPYDCCYFTYTIALSESMTQEKALHEINDFVAQHVKIV